MKLTTITPSTITWLTGVLFFLISGSVQAVDYHVDPSGSGGAYTTIQAALDAVVGQNPFHRANLLIAPGTYNEQLVVSKPYVSFIGIGSSPNDVSIVEGGPGWDPAVHVQGTATAFMAANLTLENQILDNTSQGIALRSSADKAAFLNVRFLGYQDTLLVDNNSRQYFKDVFITGDTDFIYGNATAVFDNSVIQSTDGNYITAAETNTTTANGLIFRDCSLIKGTARDPLDNNGNPASSADPNEVHLGRPWHWDSPDHVPSVVFLRTRMDNHIKDVGWNDWGAAAAGTDPDTVSRYSEFGSMNLSGNPLPLAANGVPVGRVSWADPMTQAQADQYTLDNIFGPVDFWNNNPGAQPEGTGVTYLPQGDGVAWDPVAQLALLSGIAPEPEPSNLYNIQLNGWGNTYSGVGQIGSIGDIWNNPTLSNYDNSGTAHPTATPLVTDMPLLDSNGAASAVTLSIEGLNYRSYLANVSGGDPTVGLNDRALKFDWNGVSPVPTVTIGLEGLPADARVEVFVYGAGYYSGYPLGSTWTMSAANGGAVGYCGYGGASATADPTGMDVTLPTSEGMGWDRIEGVTDSSGNLTLVVTSITQSQFDGQGAWWQTYINGLQVRVIPEPGTLGLLVVCGCLLMNNHRPR